MAGFVVAIDGRAGSGKSTTAKGVARRLNFFYLDTGAMYRAITLKYLLTNKKREKTSSLKVDLKLLRNLLKKTSIDLIQKKDALKIIMDGKDFSEEIRSPEVNGLVSQISAIGEVREWMVKKQRRIARGKNIVCEGRDMGTVVFPNARVKIFMDADLLVRARRRQKELREKGIKLKLSQVIENLKFRDEYDSKRRYAPLKISPDAIIIDTTNLTIEEEIDRVTEVVKEAIKSPKKEKKSGKT